MSLLLPHFAKYCTLRRNLFEFRLLQNIDSCHNLPMWYGITAEKR